jgi:hypothetical protein
MVLTEDVILAGVTAPETSRISTWDVFRRTKASMIEVQLLRFDDTFFQSFSSHGCRMHRDDILESNMYCMEMNFVMGRHGTLLSPEFIGSRFCRIFGWSAF